MHNVIITCFGFPKLTLNSNLFDDMLCKDVILMLLSKSISFQL